MLKSTHHPKSRSKRTVSREISVNHRKQRQTKARTPNSTISHSPSTLDLIISPSTRLISTSRGTHRYQCPNRPHSVPPNNQNTSNLLPLHHQSLSHLSNSPLVSSSRSISTTINNHSNSSIAPNSQTTSPHFHAPLPNTPHSTLHHHHHQYNPISTSRSDQHHSNLPKHSKHLPPSINFTSSINSHSLNRTSTSFNTTPPFSTQQRHIIDENFIFHILQLFFTISSSIIGFGLTGAYIKQKLNSPDKLYREWLIKRSQHISALKAAHNNDISRTIFSYTTSEAMMRTYEFQLPKGALDISIPEDDWDVDVDSLNDPNTLILPGVVYQTSTSSTPIAPKAQLSRSEKRLEVQLAYLKEQEEAELLEKQQKEEAMKRIDKLGAGATVSPTNPSATTTTTTNTTTIPAQQEKQEKKGHIAATYQPLIPQPPKYINPHLKHQEEKQKRLDRKMQKKNLIQKSQGGTNLRDSNVKKSDHVVNLGNILKPSRIGVASADGKDMKAGKGADFQNSGTLLIPPVHAVVSSTIDTTEPVAPVTLQHIEPHLSEQSPHLSSSPIPPSEPQITVDHNQTTPLAPPPPKIVPKWNVVVPTSNYSSSHRVTATPLFPHETTFNTTPIHTFHTYINTPEGTSTLLQARTFIAKNEQMVISNIAKLNKVLEDIDRLTRSKPCQDSGFAKTVNKFKPTPAPQIFIPKYVQSISHTHDQPQVEQRSGQGNGGELEHHDDPAANNSGDFEDDEKFTRHDTGSARGVLNFPRLDVEMITLDKDQDKKWRMLQRRKVQQRTMLQAIQIVDSLPENDSQNNFQLDPTRNPNDDRNEEEQSSNPNLFPQVPHLFHHYQQLIYNRLQIYYYHPASFLSTLHTLRGQLELETMSIGNLMIYHPVEATYRELVGETLTFYSTYFKSLLNSTDQTYRDLALKSLQLQGFETVKDALYKEGVISKREASITIPTGSDDGNNPAPTLPPLPPHISNPFSVDHFHRKVIKRVTRSKVVLETSESLLETCSNWLLFLRTYSNPIIRQQYIINPVRNVLNDEAFDPFEETSYLVNVERDLARKLEELHNSAAHSTTKTIININVTRDINPNSVPNSADELNNLNTTDFNNTTPKTTDIDKPTPGCTDISKDLKSTEILHYPRSNPVQFPYAEQLQIDINESTRRKYIKMCLAYNDANNAQKPNMAEIDSLELPSEDDNGDEFEGAVFTSPPFQPFSLPAPNLVIDLQKCKKQLHDEFFASNQVSQAVGKEEDDLGSQTQTQDEMPDFRKLFQQQQQQQQQQPQPQLTQTETYENELDKQNAKKSKEGDNAEVAKDVNQASTINSPTPQPTQQPSITATIPPTASTITSATSSPPAPVDKSKRGIIETEEGVQPLDFPPPPPPPTDQPINIPSPFGQNGLKHMLSMKNLPTMSVNSLVYPIMYESKH